VNSYFRERTTLTLHFLSLFTFLFSSSLNAVASPRQREKGHKKMSFIDVSKLDALPSGTGLQASRFKPKVRVKQERETTLASKRGGVDDGKNQCKTSESLTPFSPSHALSSPNIFDSTEVYEKDAPIGTGGKGCRRRPA